MSLTCHEPSFGSVIWCRNRAEAQDRFLNKLRLPFASSPSAGHPRPEYPGWSLTLRRMAVTSVHRWQLETLVENGLTICWTWFCDSTWFHMVYFGIFKNTFFHRVSWLFNAKEPCDSCLVTWQTWIWIDLKSFVIRTFESDCFCLFCIAEIHNSPWHPKAPH